MIFASSNMFSAATATRFNGKSCNIQVAGKWTWLVRLLPAYVLGWSKSFRLYWRQYRNLICLRLLKKTEAPKLDNYSNFSNTLKNASQIQYIYSSLFEALKTGFRNEDNRSYFLLVANTIHKKKLRSEAFLWMYFFKYLLFMINKSLRSVIPWNLQTR